MGKQRPKLRQTHRRGLTVKGLFAALEINQCSLPLVGLKVPDRILIRVDLPAPLSPNKATISLLLTERETSFRAELGQKTS
jgi:hypothetical protein